MFEIRNYICITMFKSDSNIGFRLQLSCIPSILQQSIPDVYVCIIIMAVVHIPFPDTQKMEGTKRYRLTSSLHQRKLEWSYEVQNFNGYAQVFNDYQYMQMLLTLSGDVRRHPRRLIGSP